MQPRNASLAAIVVLCLVPAFAMADAATARKYIGQARENIESRGWDDAESRLKMAEGELDDVTGAEKQKIVKEIEDTRKAVLAARREYERPGLIQSIRRQIDDARNNVLVPGHVQRVMDTLEFKFNEDDTKFLLTSDEIAAYRKELASIRKVAMKDQNEQEFKRLAPLVDELEKKLPDVLKTIQTESAVQAGYAARDFQGDIDRIARDVAKLPADDEKTKSLSARLTKLNDQLASAAGDSQYKEYLARLTESWKSFADETRGWQDEKTIPTAEQVTKTSSQEMSAFMAPKTIAMIRSGDRWIEVAEADEQYRQFKDKPEVKAFVEKVRAERNAAMAKMEQTAETIVAAVEKLPVRKDEIYQLDSVASAVEHNLPGSPKVKALTDRIKAMSEKVVKDAESSQAALDALAKKMCDAADAGWPKIAESIKAQDVTDPAALTKGQTIRIFGREDRLGSDFKGEDYGYAVAINGQPIVGILAPNVRDAAKSAWDKIRGTHYRCGERTDVIAVVEGRGKVGQRVRSEVTDRGGSRLGDLTRYDPVDCTIVRIIALHCGPVAVGPNGAVSDGGASESGASESGAIAPVAASGTTATAGIGASTSGGWMIAFCWSLVGLVGAAAVFMRARPEAAMQAVGPQGSATVSLVNHNLDYIGLVLASLGIAWLLMGLVVRDLLPAAALTTCGIYTASGFLRDHGILKEPMYSTLRPLGVPIALASAAIMVLHLFMGGYWLV